MEQNEGILLNSHFVNKLKVGGELAWFIKDYNASTGYTWQCYPDNSGVYEISEQVTLHPSTDAVGVPGSIIWKFKAIAKGKGNIAFELMPPGSKEPSERIIISVEVG